MKWMKRALFVGLGVIALRTFIKTLHQKGSSSLTSSYSQIQTSPAPTPVTEQVQSVTIPPTPVLSKKQKGGKGSAQKSFKKSAKKAFNTVPVLLNFLVSAILYLIVFLLIFPCIYFISNFNNIPAVSSEFRDSQTLPSQIKSASKLPNEVIPQNTLLPWPYADLSLTIKQIKHETPTKAILTGALDLSFPNHFFDSICDSNAPSTKGDEQRCDMGSPITIQKKNLNSQLKPQYDLVNLVLTVYSADGIFPQEQSLGQFFVPNSSQDIILPLTISVDTQASAYPEDWYRLSPYIDIRFSSPSLYEYNTSNSTHNHFHFVPVVVDGALDTSMSNMALVFAPPGWIYPLNGDGNGDIFLDILIQRNIYSKALIYLTTGLVPFGLLLLVAHSVAARKREKEEPLSNISLNVLIMILAVVTIRQVFIPSDIQGVLTRLDDLLLTLGSILIAVIFLAYATSIMKYFFRKKDNSPEKNTSTKSQELLQ